MKATEKKKFPDVVIAPELNKYDNVVLFPEKLAKAKEQLKKTGLPKLPCTKNSH
ncbi:hypothetical protein [Parafilimonas sp.]|uniref:hypothetical protein n=1 Tax=Parafilimonas sp. TaxID=1969739 RepID=UPI0039E27958